MIMWKFISTFVLVKSKPKPKLVRLNGIEKACKSDFTRLCYYGLIKLPLFYNSI